MPIVKAEIEVRVVKKHRLGCVSAKTFANWRLLDKDGSTKTTKDTIWSEVRCQDSFGLCEGTVLIKDKALSDLITHRAPVGRQKKKVS